MVRVAGSLVTEQPLSSGCIAASVSVPHTKTTVGAGVLPIGLFVLIQEQGAAQNRIEYYMKVMYYID